MSEYVTVAAGATASVDFSLDSDVLFLNPIQVTAGRRPEKAVEAPATVHVIGSVDVEDRPALTVVDHLRSSPGVDVIQLGVQSTNVVTRGFQNLFSGSLYVLTDNRIAGLPSLQVNLLQLLPQTNEDIERVEVVLGPGSALYGPNTADGVLHILTKSPLDYQGTTLTTGGGNQGVFTGSLWTSHKLGQDFGIKGSVRYVRGDEFEYVDPVEVQTRVSAQADPAAFTSALVERGASVQEADIALSRVGIRDFGFEQLGVDVRADWQATPNTRWVFNYGRSIGSGLQATSIGTSQVHDWIYQYFQTRFTRDRLFLQAYTNQNGAGDTYALRDGLPYYDTSRLFVAQAQYGLDVWDEREKLTFGVDYFFTNPRTRGTVHGVFEDQDNVTEVGAYVQSETSLTEQLSLVLAGRLDSHSVLDDNIFSPRAALVFSPVRDQSFRLTYNRAYAPPSALNFFADVNAGAAASPLGELGYDIRAQGARNGFRFNNPDGSLAGMRSPFTPSGSGGPSQLLPVDVATMWQHGVSFLSAQGLIDAPTTALLSSFTPTSADVGVNVLDLTSGELLPLSSATVPDVPKLKQGTNTTFEVGYQGVIDNRFLLAADVWYSQRRDIISPLVVRTPLLLMNADPAMGGDLTTWLVGQLVQAGLSVAEATCSALLLAIGDVDCDQVPDAAGNGGLAALPAATVSSPDVAATGADVLITYTNGGDLDIWGADLAMKWFLDDSWTIAGTASWMADDYFADARTASLFGLEEDLQDGVAPISLNAPKFKGSVQLGYRNQWIGFSGEARVRFQSGFPVDSGVFVGTACITGGRGGLLEQDCIDAYTLMDLTLGYKLPNWPATIQVAATNLLDEAYRSYIGVPDIGRLIMAQVRVDLF
jgi:iron complex outermembrane receptor protein